MRDLIVEWLRSGCVVRLNDQEVDSEEAAFAKQAIKSDDPHVLAVAKLSLSRVLYTNDVPLMEDFKNVKLLSPKGKIISPTTKSDIVESVLKKYCN